MKIIRWIAVLPGSVIITIAVSWLMGFGIRFWQDDSDSWQWVQILHEFIKVSFQSFWQPIILVVAGMWIAPNYKRETGVFLISALIMTGIGLVIFSIVTRYDFATRDYIFYVCHFLGCGGAFVFLPKDDEGFKDSWKE